MHRKKASSLFSLSFILDSCDDADSRIFPASIKLPWTMNFAVIEVREVPFVADKNYSTMYRAQCSNLWSTLCAKSFFENIRTSFIDFAHFWCSTSNIFWVWTPGLEILGTQEILVPLKFNYGHKFDSNFTTKKRAAHFWWFPTGEAGKHDFESHWNQTPGNLRSKDFDKISFLTPFIITIRVRW